MSMKKIFILQNSNVSFELDAELIYQPSKYDLYLIVNRFGYNAVSARNQNNFYTEIIITEDFSVDNITQRINQHIKDGSPFNIITNSEETMPVCGKIRVMMGLDENDYSRFYDKDAMKQSLANCKAIKIPKYKLFDSIRYQEEGERYLEDILIDMCYPLFIKPVALYSSINLTKVYNKGELTAWAANNNTDALYEIDQFIDGTMYHCDSYIKNGNILFTFVSQNSRPCYNFTVGEMKGTIVLPANHPDAKILSDITERVLNEMVIPDGGVTHMEVIKTTDNQVYFIEIAHRSPGCLIPKMHQTHSGINTVASHYLLQIDPDYNPMPNISTYAAWACYPKIPGIIKSLKNPSMEITSSIEIEWKFGVGDIIQTYSQYGRDYTGTIFIVNDNFDELFRDFISINNDNLCQIEQVFIEPSVTPA